jgi:CheY-like chemotaxis protein
MADLRKFKLLIVEDDIISASLVKSILEPTEIQIVHTITGLEAVKLIKKGYKPDIILMDMRLPEMDGYEATRIIKEIYPTLPIIAQTAFGMTEDREKCLNAGCNDYLTKPLSEESLIKIFEKFLYSKGK